jgi:hypothetical protein
MQRCLLELEDLGAEDTEHALRPVLALVLDFTLVVSLIDDDLILNGLK